MLNLIDSDFLLFFCTYSKDKKELSFEEVQKVTKEFLIKIFSETNSTDYIGFFTAGNNYRKLVYPEYKANRRNKPVPNWLRELKLWLIDNYNFVEHDGLEADDCVNIYKHKYPEAIITSNDKDVLMLPGLHYNPIKNTFIASTPEEYNYRFWSSMITGDPGDNIKGIPGYGPRTAKNILINDLENGFQYKETTLLSYCKVYGEHQGILEFYKNYMCLKILDNFPTDAYQFFEPKKIDNDFRTIQDESNNTNSTIQSF